jgi:hypothetical protein
LEGSALERCGQARGRGAAYIAAGGCTVDAAYNSGARVQGFAIGQRGGGGACPARARVFGSGCCAGNGRERRGAEMHRGCSTDGWRHGVRAADVLALSSASERDGARVHGLARPGAVVFEQGLGCLYCIDGHVLASWLVHACADRRVLQ